MSPVVRRILSRSAFGVGLALMPMLSGCCIYHTGQWGHFSREQVMVIDGRGRQLEPVGNVTATKYTSLVRMDEVIARTDEMVYARKMAGDIRQRLEKGERVVIFFHGGLNLQVGAMGRVQRVNDYAKSNSIPHLVFVNWQSSFMSSYRDRLFAIREGRDFRYEGWVKNTATKLTSPLYLVSDLAVSVGRLPVSLERQTATGIASSNPWESDEIQRVEAELRSQTSLAGLHPVPDEGPDLGCIVPSWLLFPCRVVTTPLVDGLGGPSWDVMQRRTTILYEREGSGVEHQGPLYKFGLALVEALGTNRYAGKLDLIGHSMGAILGTDLLRRFPDVHFDRVVFMAAACRVRDVADGVLPYLADPRNRDTLFYSLMLHPKAEIREAPLFHVAPEGSLLVWLDQMFEKPDALLDRMAGRYVNVGLTARYLAQEAAHLDSTLGQRIIFKTFPYHRGPANMGPMHHGDFSEFDFWEERFWDPAATGAYKGYGLKAD